jgi:hypothetical protein
MKCLFPSRSDSRDKITKRDKNKTREGVGLFSLTLPEGQNQSLRSSCRKRQSANT